MARLQRASSNIERRTQFLPKLSREDFLRLSATADVLLDTIHFCGGNTSYEAFAMGTPVVTMPGELLRGRLTHAMYQQLELPELSVNSPAAYVELAVKLGMNRDYRQHIRGEIAQRSGVLFEDHAMLREYENFFRQAVNSRRN